METATCKESTLLQCSSEFVVEGPTHAVTLHLLCMVNSIASYQAPIDHGSILKTLYKI